MMARRRRDGGALRRARRRRRQRRDRPGELATTRGISVEEWERVFEVDLLGVWRTVRAALPQIVERRGHVVVISSVYAFMNGVLNSPYAVAKAGVESLGRTLRTELTPLGRAPASPTSAGSTPRWCRTRSSARTPAACRKTARLAAASGSRPARPERPGRRHRGTRAADLRAEVVALRLRPARHPQPAARPPPRTRRDHAHDDPRGRGGRRRAGRRGGRFARVSRSSRKRKDS